MSDATFRLALPGEEKRIVAFINDHFDMRLPLVNRPEFYRHYYQGRSGRPQFALAEREGELLSVAGYILANCTPAPDAWVSIWVAVKGANGIGLELMNAMPGLIGANVLACNNIRKATCAFYRFLGWQAERLPHYYRLSLRPAYALAKPNVQPLVLPAGGDLDLTRIADAAELVPLGMPPTPHTPVKDTWYLRRRYFYYPHYTYDVWAAKERGAGKLLAYVVTRTVPAADTGSVPVVRVVDFIGADEVLPRIGLALDRVMKNAGAEYMDCYNAGIPAETWAAAGFAERIPGDGVTIPNYLAPPLAESTEYYYFTNRPENFVMFKADGDQDRPNLPNL